MSRIVIVCVLPANGPLKSGSNGVPVPVSLEDVDIPIPERAAAIVALDEALDRLGKLDDRMARVVECRFFAGLTESETAAALAVSQRTVAREWVTAKGWLYQELRGAAG